MAVDQQTSQFAAAVNLGFLIRLIMAACLVSLASQPAAALDQVSLQLKWEHQFQFAGYYAALEQGFHRFCEACHVVALNRSSRSRALSSGSSAVAQNQQ
jgi:hypothetical protein